MDAARLVNRAGVKVVDRLAIEALRRSPQLGDRDQALADECRAAITRATTSTREHFEDPSEIREWVWTDE